MKSLIAIAGVVILVIGIAVLGYGATNSVTNTSTFTTTTAATVIPQTSRNIDANGIWSSGATVLQKGEIVTGTFSISNYSSSAGHAFFYIQNESQFIAWGACAPCSSNSIQNQTSPSSGSWSFTWTVPNNGAFYFVFDDESYGSGAMASFVSSGAMSSGSVSTTTSPNTTLDYSGVALIIVGAIVLAIGIVVASPAKKPMGMQQEPTTTQQPMNPPK